MKWTFHVTTLGPVSAKQEESLGPILPFLRSRVGGNQTNGGSFADPITIVIVDNHSGGGIFGMQDQYLGKLNRQQRGSLSFFGMNPL